jgi:hypothetical protein
LKGLAGVATTAPRLAATAPRPHNAAHTHNSYFECLARAHTHTDTFAILPTHTLSLWRELRESTRKLTRRRAAREPKGVWGSREGRGGEGQKPTHRTVTTHSTTATPQQPSPLNSCGRTCTQQRTRSHGTTSCSYIFDTYTYTYAYTHTQARTNAARTPTLSTLPQRRAVSPATLVHVTVQKQVQCNTGKTKRGKKTQDSYSAPKKKSTESTLTVYDLYRHSKLGRLKRGEGIECCFPAHRPLCIQRSKKEQQAFYKRTRSVQTSRGSTASLHTHSGADTRACTLPSQRRAHNEAACAPHQGE